MDSITEVKMTSEELKPCPFCGQSAQVMAPSLFDFMSMTANSNLTAAD